METERVEWGVMWHETGEAEPTASKAEAERLQALHVWDSSVVSRTWTVTEWAQ